MITFTARRPSAKFKVISSPAAAAAARFTAAPSRVATLYPRAIAAAGEILVLDMGEPVRIVDLAADMIRLSGLEVGHDDEIEFTGLRPGEKLTEELYVRGETRLPTRHPKITVADRTHGDPAAIPLAIEQLLRLAADRPELVVEQLQRIVPEYVRSHPPPRSEPPMAA